MIGRERSMTPAQAAILNKIETPGYIAYAFMMPTRIIRVLADESFRSFRVERLSVTGGDRHDPKGTWHLHSFHTDAVPGAMLQMAMQAAARAQVEVQQQLARRLSKPGLVT